MLAHSLSKTPCLGILVAFASGILLSSYDKHHNLSLMAIGCGALLYIVLLLYPKVFCHKPSNTAEYIRRGILLLALYLSIGGIGLGYTHLRTHHGQTSSQSTTMQEQIASSLSPNKDISHRVQTLLSGVCLGYMPKSEAVRELRQTFSLSGAAHILAVSGFHLAVVVWAMAMMLRPMHLRPPLYRICLILSAWAFTALVGFNIPAVRAAIMLSLYILAQVLDRERYTPNILTASLIIQLIIDPYDLYRWGMWLSYTAVFSIYLFYPRLRYSLGYIRQPLLRNLWEALSLSLAAQILTLPLCLHLFGFISWAFIFTAIPLTILSTLLIPLGLITYGFACIGFSLSPLNYAVESLGNMMIGLSQWGASLDVLVQRIDFPLWAMLLLWGISLLAYALVEHYFPPRRYYRA